jgi:hypothetical protein
MGVELTCVLRLLAIGLYRMKIDIVERYTRTLVDKVMPKRALSHFDTLNKDIFGVIYGP